MPVARRENWVNLLSASAAPIARMVTKISLRTRRRRVCADRESVVSPETFDATRLPRAITRRSTANAIATATPIVTRAAIRSCWPSARSSTFGDSPWFGWVPA